MSDSEDDRAIMAARIEAELEEKQKEAQEIEKKYNAGILYWKTNALGQVKIQNLKTSHVINTEKFLRRKRNVYDPVSEMWLEIFKREIIKRQSER